MPIVQKVGATFKHEYIIPEKYLDGALKDHVIKVHLRKARSNLNSDFIAELNTTWLNPRTTRTLIIRHLATDNWPVGEAVFEIKLIDPIGNVEFLDEVEVLIKPSITK